MQFVYILKPVRKDMASTGPNKVEEAVMVEHVRYVEELARRGMLVLAGQTNGDEDHTFGIAVFEAGSEACARDMMNKDPAVWRGVMTGELYPFRIAVKGNGHGG